MGCNYGLTLTFPDPPAGTTYGIKVMEQLDGGTDSLFNCTLAAGDAGGSVLMCNSGPFRASENGASITTEYMPAAVHVVISNGTTTVAEHSYTPKYTSTEINGPGCGVCTSGQITVTVP